MSSLAENILIAGAKNRPPMLEKGGYDTSQCQTCMQTLNDLTPKERIRKKCDIRAANIILHRLPNEIYALLNHKKKAYDIWYRVKELMEGTELTKQEKESKLADEFDRFASEKGYMIHSYYMRGGYFAKQYTVKKRVKDSEWFKEKMLLAQQQEVGIEIDAEQKDFLDDGLEGFVSDCEDLQLNATSILITDKVDVYNLEVDDAPTTSAIFMAKLSPVGSINGNEVHPSYDSNILSELPNYDIYQANEMFNSFV
ncbi:hypothetical protein Tco_1236635 [Tanacetum coccineum]